MEHRVERVRKPCRMQRFADVVLEELEAGPSGQCGGRARRAGRQIVDAQHAYTGLEQTFAQRKTDESRSPGDQYPLELPHVGQVPIR